MYRTKNGAHSNPGPSAHPLLTLAEHPIIAHRGASAEAPENTLEAFDLAVRQGADALELDVRLSADGVPVVLHDPTLDRTCGRPGLVAELTLKQLLEADAGAGFRSPEGSRPFAGRGVVIPTLAEVLERFPGLPLLVEIKAPEAQHAVADLLERTGAATRTVLASFKPRALEAFRRSPFLVGADRRDAFRLYVLTRLGLSGGEPRCLCYAVPWRWKNRIEVPTPRFVAAARRHGRPVHVWTVDDPAIARELWRRGTNGIITNRPGQMRQALTGI